MVSIQGPRLLTFGIPASATVHLSCCQQWICGCRLPKVQTRLFSSADCMETGLPGASLGVEGCLARQAARGSPWPAAGRCWPLDAMAHSPPALHHAEPKLHFRLQGAGTAGLLVHHRQHDGVCMARPAPNPLLVEQLAAALLDLQLMARGSAPAQPGRTAASRRWRTPGC